NGTVRVKVDGKEGYFGTLDENGQAIIEVPGLVEGPHTIDVVYDGNDYYLNATGSGNVEVQAPITYKVNGTGNDSEVDVKVPGNGTVEIFIDNEPRDVISDENGNAVANLTGLLPGQHNITIKYTDENDVVSYVNSTVVVPRWTSMVEASAATIRQGDSAFIKVKVDSNETGTVYVDIDGTGYYGVLENGTVTINASGIKKGTYTGNVTYLGDEKYDPSNNTFTLVVESEITIDIEGAGNSSQVVVKLPENGTDNVTVTVDGNNYPVTIVNGTAVADLSGLPAGEHNVTVIYTDKDGTQSVASKIVKVYDSINVADEIRRGWNSPFDAEAEFLDSEGHVLQNATVQFTIDGKTYDVVTDEKGIGKLTTSHLPIGTYEATIKNTVTGETLTRKVTIVKRIIENYDLTTDYLEGKYYSVKVIGDGANPVGAGEVVGMTVNGVGYVIKTDKDGVAQLKINLIPKKYTIKAEYAKYQVTNKITVKQTMKLVKKTVTVKKGKKITLKATL
ncbi:Ig-like domain-containing protein, partial [Methanobrevibacter sp.]